MSKNKKKSVFLRRKMKLTQNNLGQMKVRKLLKKKTSRRMDQVANNF